VQLNQVLHNQSNKMAKKTNETIKKKEKIVDTIEKNDINEKEKSIDNKQTENKEETPEVKTTEKEKIDKPIDKKDKTIVKEKRNEAIVNGRNLAMGTKHSAAVSNFIRNKDIDTAIQMLEDVVLYKRAIPMRGEIPHRKGMMSGRYPINASKIFIRLLKSLKSNAIAGELELEKFKIYVMPNKAARAYKRFGQGRFKRSHVLIKLIPIKKEKKK
jgi:large subunit ribosomal protein L22